MNIKKQMAFLAAMAVMATTTGCSNAVNDILTNVDNGDYSKAESLYSTNEFKDKQTKQLVEELSKRIENAVSNYADDKIDYESSTGLLYGISLMEISELSHILSDSFNTVDDLRSSKSYYASAEESYKNEDYVSAYNCYTSVIEKDCNYDDAVSKMKTCIDNYKTQIRKKVDEYVMSNEYDEAISYLTNCSYSGLDGVEELTKSMLEEIRVKSIIAEADNSYKEGDIEQALSVISVAQEEYKLSNNDTLNKYKDDICTEYVEMIIKKANDLCDSENYILALNMLNTAYELTSSEELTSLINHIQEIKPTYLYDLKVSESKFYETVDSGDPLKDTLGNVYPVGNLFEIQTDSDDWDDQEGYAKYCLGYKYDTLSGTIAVDDISATASAKIKIIGDGVTLFELPLSRTTTPTQFSIDVSSVNWLEISMTDAADGDIYAILSNFILGNGSASTPATTPETTENTTEVNTETDIETVADSNE